MAGARRPVAPRAGRAGAPSADAHGSADDAAGASSATDGVRRSGAAPARRPAGDGGLHLPSRTPAGLPASARARAAGAAPAPEPRRRARAADSLPAPRGLTRRAAALAVLLLVVVAALAPYLHATISQRAEIADARAELAATEADVADLEQQVQRWQDPAYVERQARQRLALVMPGDVPYRVVGVPPSRQAARDPREAAADGVRASADRPWFGVLWDSVGEAGREAAGR
ncbi:septum formation initiator family protein [uncultured Pseudokineococcus sp.]|uniref:FtsB family cell division protein n=1 Tax=uncultured Pseudokineococcus sp. TaxID=1642928 RepID=UPI00261EED32|nr:septum formation initiator family protein [uncultured Pseudokineococcus sp.]